jgi:hypothetical protein
VLFLVVLCDWKVLGVILGGFGLGLFLWLCTVGLVRLEMGRGMSVLGGIDEVFVARVVAGGKVTIPLRVREVLQLEKGDYVRVTITEVIRKKKQQQRKKKSRKGVTRGDVE